MRRQSQSRVEHRPQRPSVRHSRPGQNSVGDGATWKKADSFGLGLIMICWPLILSPVSVLVEASCLCHLHRRLLPRDRKELRASLIKKSNSSEGDQDDDHSTYLNVSLPLFCRDLPKLSQFHFSGPSYPRCWGAVGLRMDMRLWTIGIQIRGAGERCLGASPEWRR